MSARTAWGIVHSMAAAISLALLVTLLWNVLRYGEWTHRNAQVVDHMSPRDTIEFLLIFGILSASALRGFCRDYIQ